MLRLTLTYYLYSFVDASGLAGKWAQKEPPVGIWGMDPTFLADVDVPRATWIYDVRSLDWLENGSYRAIYENLGMDLAPWGHLEPLFAWSVGSGCIWTHIEYGGRRRCLASRWHRRPPPNPVFCVSNRHRGCCGTCRLNHPPQPNVS